MTRESNEQTMPARVLWGANNVFSVQMDDGTVLFARLKGKRLLQTKAQEADDHNPLATGDRVEVFVLDDGAAQIVTRHERRNRIARWNRKTRRTQTIATNLDRLLVVSSYGEPPFRSRFVDRVLAMAEIESVPAGVVINKSDVIDPESSHLHSINRYLTLLQQLGYTVWRTSTITGESLSSFRNFITGTTSVLFGQSGVGKSSLINAVFPEADLTVGDISRKYNRGRHTTTGVRPIVLNERTVLVDTPGVREFDLTGYDLSEVAAGFVEFVRFIPDCTMPGCTHLHEPGCAVRTALEKGIISQERYASYRKIAEEFV